MEPSQRFPEELEWCVNQILIGLLYNQVSSEQLHESAAVLRSLTSTEAPVIRKRQRMREVFGDYRKAMKQTPLPRTRELVRAKDWQRLCAELRVSHTIPDS